MQARSDRADGGGSGGGGQLPMANSTMTPRASSKAIGGSDAAERVSASTGGRATAMRVHAPPSQVHVVVRQPARSHADASCWTSITAPRAASYAAVPAAIRGWSWRRQAAPSHVHVYWLP